MVTFFSLVENSYMLGVLHVYLIWLWDGLKVVGKSVKQVLAAVRYIR